MRLLALAIILFVATFTRAQSPGDIVYTIWGEEANEYHFLTPLPGLSLVIDENGELDLAEYQPLSADLTAISELSTTAYGRSLLTQTSASTLTASLLDNLSPTQGSLLFRGATGWQSLSPGTSGQILSTGGAGANPSWIDSPATPPGGSEGQFQYKSGDDFAGSSQLFLSSGNVVLAPTSVVEIRSGVDPSTNPPAGRFWIYVSSSTGDLMVRGSDGTVTTLAPK